MGRAKDIVVKVIPAKVAVPFVKRIHYSGTFVHNSTLHFGVFLDGKMHGAMSFGNPLDKRKVITLVNNTRWNEMLELNRMAFDDFLPKNSESRALSVAFKLIRKNAPHIKWILSFSDGVQCGDGTIYRASGFELTGIKKSTQVIETPWGQRVTRKTLTHVGFKERERIMRRLNIPETGKSSVLPFLKAGCRNVEGFQLRYIKILDKSCTLQCASIPFSKIKEVGAGMYKGEKTGG